MPGVVEQAVHDRASWEKSVVHRVSKLEEQVETLYLGALTVAVVG